jgi:hypothetical protein
MVCHEHVGVHPAMLAGQRRAQPIEVSKPVLLIEEARRSIVPTLHDVQRQAVNVDSATAGHTRSLA